MVENAQQSWIELSQDFSSWFLDLLEVSSLMKTVRVENIILAYTQFLIVFLELINTWHLSNLLTGNDY